MSHCDTHPRGDGRTGLITTGDEVRVNTDTGTSISGEVTAKGENLLRLGRNYLIQGGHIEYIGKEVDSPERWGAVDSITFA